MTDVQENYKYQRKRERPFELDVYLPRLKLAFEYQGEQHYVDIHTLGSKWHQKQRDQDKKEACKKHEITLIEIPYWWDFKHASLTSTIRSHRADLLTEVTSDSKPIPNIPPQGFRKSIT